MKNQLESSIFVVRITAINGDLLEEEIKMDIEASNYKEAEINALIRVMDKATTYNVWSISTTKDMESLCDSVDCHENCDGDCHKCIPVLNKRS